LARLPIARLVQSVRDVPGLPFNVFHHGSVTTAELAALAALGRRLQRSCSVRLAGDQ
jgi:hypothetical protein